MAKVAAKKRAWRNLATAAVACSLFCLSATPARAWFDGPHVVVAQIAHDRLSPNVRAEADRLIGVLADFEPVRADFVSASVWMDEIKFSGWRTFDRWHYVNIPYNAGGLAELPAADTDNAIWAVEDAIRTLANPEAPDFAKAFSLRVLIHVVADLHQPLHCTSRYTQELPDGDRGGTLFELDEGNLHFFWDDAAGLLSHLDSSSPSEQVTAAAVELLAAVPEETLPDWNQLDPAVWARESFRLATTVVYVGILEGRAPPEGYRIRTQLVSQRRLVTAAFRLAALLEQALAPPESGSPQQRD